MDKKKLIQKLNQLRDTLTGVKKKELQKDILKLKLSKDDKLILTLTNKYYEDQKNRQKHKKHFAIYIYGFNTYNYISINSINN